MASLEEEQKPEGWNRDEEVTTTAGTIWDTQEEHYKLGYQQGLMVGKRLVLQSLMDELENRMDDLYVA